MASLHFLLLLLIGALAIILGWKILKFALKILILLLCLLAIAAAVYYFSTVWEPCTVCGLTP